MIAKDLENLARPIDTLKSLPGNPRKGDVDAVARSYERFGQRKPIVATKDGTVIAGNHQLAAARKLGWSQIAVVFVDDDELTAKAFALADNRTADLGTYDNELLAELLADVAVDENLLGATGYNTGDLDELIASLETPEPLLGDPDEIPAKAPAKTVRGDVWLLGEHRLMCGDSTVPTDVERLMVGKKADAIVTDPPYGIGIDGQKASQAKNPKHNRKAHDFREWDGARPDESVFVALLDMDCPSVIWGGNYFADLLPPTRGWIYWSKGQDGLTMSDGELAWTTEDKPLRCVTVNRAALHGSVHPTQKPLQVITFALDYINASGNVFDPFGGSGTTLMAAQQTGRTCYTMELNEHYCDIICARFQKTTGIMPIAESTGNQHDFLEGA